MSHLLVLFWRGSSPQPRKGQPSLLASFSMSWYGPGVESRTFHPAARSHNFRHSLFPNTQRKASSVQPGKDLLELKSVSHDCFTRYLRESAACAHLFQPLFRSRQIYLRAHTRVQARAYAHGYVLRTQTDQHEEMKEMSHRWTKKVVEEKGVGRGRKGKAAAATAESCETEEEEAQVLPSPILSPLPPFLAVPSHASPLSPSLPVSLFSCFNPLSAPILSRSSSSPSLSSFLISPSLLH